MKIGRVPHPSIDTEGSWAKSAYHGWRFGYGLHVICNQYRFPINAWVTTACVKDHSLIEQLLAYLNQYVGILVGDRGYFALKTLKKYIKSGIFSFTHLIYSKIYLQKRKIVLRKLIMTLLKRCKQDCFISKESRPLNQYLRLSKNFLI